MEEKRRFRRSACHEAVIVRRGKDIVKARVLDISLKGALLEFNDDAFMGAGDACQLTLSLKNSDVVMQFRARVAHSRKHLLGVEFVHMDIDTFIHLRSLVEARTANPQQVADELPFLISDGSA